MKDLTEYIKLFKEMINQRIVPYPTQNFSKGKTKEELLAVAKQYFPNDKFAYEKALAIYDWTTAGFFRQKIWLHYQRDDGTIDLYGLTEAIRSSNWFDYHVENPIYMHSFNLSVATNRNLASQTHGQIYEQLNLTAIDFLKNVFAQHKILSSALEDLPKVKISRVPFLARGADVESLGIVEEAIGRTHLFRHVRESKDSYLKPGAIITTKTPWSTCDTMQDAARYAKGIIIKMLPSPHMSEWDCRYITPFSNNVSKVEYLCPTGMQFIVQNAIWSYTNQTSKELELHLIPLPYPNTAVTRQIKLNVTFNWSFLENNYFDISRIFNIEMSKLNFTCLGKEFIFGFSEAILKDIINGNGWYIFQLAIVGVVNYMLDESLSYMIVYLGCKFVLEKRCRFSEETASVITWTMLIILNIVDNGIIIALANNFLRYLTSKIGRNVGHQFGDKIQRYFEGFFMAF